MTEDPDSARMLECINEIGIPLMKDPKELKEYLEYGVDPSAAITTKVKATLNNPRVSIFFGEEGKGEVSYQTWASEVRSLKKGKLFPDEIVLQSVRRSLRGHAADQLRFIGENPTLDDILDNFESTYGTVETAESILKRFYACRQGIDESVVDYCMRLEEIHAKAVEMEVLKEMDGMLKRVFYRGLNTNLKHLSAFKFESDMAYKDFKRVVRQIEAELEEDKISGERTEMKTRCQAATKKEEKTEKPKTELQLGDLMSMMEKLNTRLENLERGQQSAQCFQQSTPLQCDDQAQPVCQQIPARQTQSPYTQQTQQMHGQTRAHNTQFPPQVSSYQQQFPQGQGYCQPQQFGSQDQGFSQPQPYLYRPVGWRGHKHFRGPRSSRPRGQGPFRGQGRGNNSYRFQRPITGSTMQPECWSCQEKGHIARDCPLKQ